MFCLPTLRNIPLLWFGKSDTNLDFSDLSKFHVGIWQHWESWPGPQSQLQAAGCRLPVLCSTSSPSCPERSFTHGCTHSALQFQGWARPLTASLLSHPFSLEVCPLGPQSSLRRKGLGKRIMQASVDTSPELLIRELWGPRNPECSLEGGRCGRPEGASAWP